MISIQTAKDQIDPQDGRRRTSTIFFTSLKECQPRFVPLTLLQVPLSATGAQFN